MTCVIYNNIISEFPINVVLKPHQIIRLSTCIPITCLYIMYKPRCTQVNYYKRLPQTIHIYDYTYTGACYSRYTSAAHHVYRVISLKMRTRWIFYSFILLFGAPGAKDNMQIFVKSKRIFFQMKIDLIFSKYIKSCIINN